VLEHEKSHASHSCLSICPKGLMSQSNGTRHSLIGRAADGVGGKVVMIVRSRPPAPRLNSALFLGSGALNSSEIPPFPDPS
jgi:hypothetical protein